MIRLEDLLSRERVVLGFEATSRAAVLEELARILGGTDDSLRELISENLMDRERAGTTGIGHGFAFPHARVPNLSSIRLAVLRTREPVPFDSLDGLPVDVFVGVAGPVEMRRDYLSVLSRLSWATRDEESRDRLRQARDPASVVAIFHDLVAAATDGS